jgi:hypothetical protein
LKTAKVLLKVKDLKRINFNEFDIAKMMGEKSSTIKEWYTIMELMDEYLEYLNFSGIYTRLDKKEDLFINLSKSLRQYVNGSTKVKWEYNNLDVNELKIIAFNHIRANYEGKEFRKIVQPSAKDSIFCRSRELWDEFKKGHDKIMESYEEPDIEEIRKKNPKEDLSKILRGVDADFEKSLKSQLIENVTGSLRYIDDLNSSNKPIELARRAKSTLYAIDTSQPLFLKSRELYQIIKDINEKTSRFLEIIDGGNT